MATTELYVPLSASSYDDDRLTCNRRKGAKL